MLDDVIDVVLVVSRDSSPPLVLKVLVLANVIELRDGRQQGLTSPAGSFQVLIDASCLCDVSCGCPCIP